jgi:peptidyl-tRNA hydrolase
MYIFIHIIKPMDPIMYIIVNSDLKLTVGQVASQVAHIVHLIVEENMQNAYESYPVPESYVTYLKWRYNPVTIVKKASEEQLNELLNTDGAKSFHDETYNKQTKMKSQHLTVVGFSPSCTLEPTMNLYDLL